MTRYLKLYMHFLAFSFGQGFEFRFDFFVRIFMDILYLTINIAFYKVIFAHTNLLADWGEGQIMIFIAGYMLVDSFVMAIFSNNIFLLPIFIQKGDLDYYLIRPVSSLFFLSLRSFSASSFFNVLISLGFVTWATVTYSEFINVYRIPLFILLVLNGAVLHYIMVMFFNILVFWSHSGVGFVHIAWALTKFRERPHGIFRGGVRFALMTIIPYSLMASVPASFLFGEEGWLAIGHIFAVTVVLFSLMAYFWQVGLRNYSSASS